MVLVIFSFSMIGSIFVIIEILLRFFLYKKCFSFTKRRAHYILFFCGVTFLYLIASFFAIPLYGKRFLSVVLDIVLVFGITKGLRINRFLTGLIPAILTLVAEMLSLLSVGIYRHTLNLSSYVESESGGRAISYIYLLYILVLYIGLIWFLHTFPQKRYYSASFYILLPIQVILIMFVTDKMTDFILLSDKSISLAVIKHDMLYILLSILGIVIIFCIMINFQGVVGEREKNAVTFGQRTQLELINFKERHAAVEYYQELKHDMKEYLFLVKSYTENKKYDELEAFSSQLSQDMSKYESLNLSENIFLNDLLTYKKKIAEEAGIDFDIDIQYKGGFGLDDESLCSLFGNALNNAIEACEQVQDSSTREIYLGIFCEDGWIRILIENSYVGDNDILLVKNLKTTKIEKGHGIGVKRMQKIVEMAGGYLDIVGLQDYFKLKILLPGEVR